ncbi:PilZ domain-containing protein [Rhizobium calliandrae]|uniref:PilZ domain-containing protein n=1 Tax=Rhizobium calliandrae TaxID=1312182 RepID=A0ABT7KDB9_9HYPH|nr:PilZ domain-containing protein [Rhizobium calliandrae]MDL2406602.1 PilZ domain-containing protein [Rhizobium calliandrae]
MQPISKSLAQSNLKIKTRRSPRKRVRLMGRVRYFAKAVAGRIVDISTDGIALDLLSPIYAAAGSKVRVECDEIGILDGVVRWTHSGRIGIEFDPTSNASAQVASYFRFFHKDIQPVLKR